MDRLQRFPEQGVTERAALDDLLDSQWVGVLSCVADGRPLAVPMLYARDGDRILLHGSTGAGALRRVAAGAPAVLTVFALDALVVAPTTFESSVNYRSATVRGPLETLSDEAREAALDRFSEVLVPGRTTEVRPPNRKELAATLALSLPIRPDGWLLKVADDWPATPEEADADPDVWSGLVPVRTVLDPPVPAPAATGLPVPPSVDQLVARRSAGRGITT
ncbi:pyridoxamine 5'-phosphate oxidase [Nocardioides sp. Root1257]|uniref:pyridoxamine 5'-phosphate oxidase family protein n=1 Tax=unclassified Nocardioides TaxID=2615069 RepID=UPI0006F311B8|nr:MULTISPECIES: pyridoxamine 5'-phosphate oxidase family protein [unclassified Nocardioides]KQW47510.1 pyridoxamine 5'-phosphate oxidase [Nocardioides sp. Root1257]KRC45666.1 pyridoxamine 5'-phosphate oxidase [Nocardioides sp. Root224]